MTLDLPDDALLAAIETSMGRAVRDVLTGWPGSPGMLHDLGKQVGRQAMAISSALLNDESFLAEMRAEMRAALLRGAAAGAEEEGRKMGVQIAKAAGKLQTLQALLPLGAR